MNSSYAKIIAHKISSAKAGICIASGNLVVKCGGAAVMVFIDL
jgi:hypothetical protein